MFSRWSITIGALLMIAAGAIAQPVGGVHGYVVMGNHGFAPGARVYAVSESAMDTVETIAGPMGGYELDDMAVGPWELHAQFDGLHGETDAVIVAGVSIEVNIFLGGGGGGGSLHGRVSIGHPNGPPAVGATVVATGGNGQSFTAQTNGEGIYEIPEMDEGWYFLVATLEGVGIGERDVFVSGNHPTEADIVLRLPGSVIGHVRIEGPDGPPAVGATVACLGGFDSLMTTTNAEGFYTFPVVAAGHYDVMAYLEGSGWGHREIFVESGAQVVANIFLHLDAEGSVVGAVIDESGEGIAGAIVSLDGFRDPGHGNDGRHYVTVANDSGQFIFPTVVEGPYSISAWAMGFGFASTVIEVLPDQTTNVTLVLHEPGHGGDSARVVELSGVAMIDTIQDHGHVYIRYMLDGGNSVPDGEPDYELDFGSPDYDPGNGATRPEAGQTITITGLLHEEHHGLPDVFVLTINGMFWQDDPGGHHGGGGDSLIVVELQGTAIVVLENPMEPARYFLDVDNDGDGDYRLCFGPPWYNPPSGATRPENGDEITITGGLLGYAEPPGVVVYTINGLFWRERGRGHGGHGGNGGGCNPDSLTWTEQEGTAMVLQRDERAAYRLDTDGDAVPDFVLDFGEPDYDPGNGATRPEDGDFIHIVGGMWICDRVDWPIIVVYEINGQFWRAPGDTTGMGADWMAVSEPVAIGVPATHLTASNYPNPFNPVTSIEYSLPKAGNISIKVFDVTGREVTTLLSGFHASGTYRITWDAAAQPSGIYFYRLTAGAEQFTSRMVLLK